MIIKVKSANGSGETIFNSEKDMVMIVLSAVDKKRILEMPSDFYTYCTYPKDTPKEQVKEFMKNPMG